MPDVLHKFTSAIGDGGDVTLVHPSNWNDDHTWPLAYDEGHLTLADGQYTFQFGRLILSSTNRLTMQGATTAGARMVLFGWFGLPEPAMYLRVGSPFRFTVPFRIPDGYAYRWMGRLIIGALVRGVLEGDAEMKIFDDNSSSRFVLTGRG